MPEGVYKVNHGGWPKKRYCPVCGRQMTRTKRHDGRWCCTNEECSLISCKWKRGEKGRIFPLKFIFEGISVLPLRYVGRT